MNDFNRFGRTFQVRTQAEGSFRADPADIQRLKTRNAEGGMVPLGSVLDVQWRSGSDRIVRYNLFPSAEIQGDAAPGYSSGDAIATMERLAATVLPPGFGIAWTDIAYQEQLAGNSAIFIFPLCVLFVFLVHSAEYESWSLALAIILIAPVCLPFALGGVVAARHGQQPDHPDRLRHADRPGGQERRADRRVREAAGGAEGRDRFAAAVEACRLRLRPILMTAFAFILGVVPMVTATGPGAEMRQVLGTTVFSGMLGVTFFGLFLTPAFYVILRRSAERKRLAAEARAEPPPPERAVASR